MNPDTPTQVPSYNQGPMTQEQAKRQMDQYPITPKIKPGYSPDTITSMLTKSLWDPGRVPCFRRAMLWGIGTGLVIGTSTFFTIARRSMWAATNYGFVGFFFGAAAGWGVCRFRLQKKQEEIRNVVISLQQMESTEREKDNHPLALSREEQERLAKIKSASVTESLKK